MNWKWPLSRPCGFSDFILTYLAICIFYRFSMLTEALLAHRIWEKDDVAAMLLGLLDDLMIGMIFCLIVLITQACVRSNKLKNALLMAILTLVAILFLINKKLFLILSIHLSLNSFTSSLADGLTLHYLFPFMNALDWLFIFFPILFLLFLSFSKKSLADTLLYFAASGIIILSLTFSLLLMSMRLVSLCAIANVVFYPNPIHCLLTNTYEILHNPYTRAQDKPSEAQMHSIALIDPAFVSKPQKIVPLSAKNNKQWNIVFIVMESVGYPYVFTNTKNAIPMPFLQSLAKNGWWLTQHYTSGNNSPNGAFGLFSGIYPSPLPTHAMMRSDIRIPNLATWLGPTYDSFFVTPADTRLYFPQAFIKNTGFKQFYDANNLPIANKKCIYSMYINDYLALDFLLTRINQATKPFLAVYWPCATHHPYVPYPNHPFLMTNDSPYAHYVNNLNVIDDQLRRIVNFLEQKKLMQHTILIVVGDHGEGFGQHPGQGGWLHGGALYQEQITIPTLIYQPALFPARHITELTSGIDLLPTLLDALHIPHPNSFQGESLFHLSQNRKYIFVYGENNEIAAIDQHHIKTKLSFEEGTCSRFDLMHDPLEQHPTLCEKETISAILKFRNYQPVIFEAVNHAAQYKYSVSLPSKYDKINKILGPQTC